jgi:hypothetical protein
MSKTALANILLVIHFAWALWMVSGVLIALLGFLWSRLWTWRRFRIAHLIGLVLTATTPLWPGGTCPLTIWEWQLRAAGSPVTQPESFIIHWIREVLFWDVDPAILTMISATGAAAAAILFFFRPPWKSYQ